MRAFFYTRLADLLFQENSRQNIGRTEGENTQSNAKNRSDIRTFIGVLHKPLFLLYYFIIIK